MHSTATTSHSLSPAIPSTPVVVFDIGKVLVPEGDRVARLQSFLANLGVNADLDALMNGYWNFRDDYDLGMPDEEK